MAIHCDGDVGKEHEKACRRLNVFLTDSGTPCTGFLNKTIRFTINRTFNPIIQTDLRKHMTARPSSISHDGRTMHPFVGEDADVVRNLCALSLMLTDKSQGPSFNSVFKRLYLMSPTQSFDHTTPRH